MSELSLLGLAGLLVGVAFGSTLPVLPTGALVSAGAVVAHDAHPALVLLVVAVGALGAYLGDWVTFVALRRAGPPLARRVPWLRVNDPESTIRTVGERLEEHSVSALLVSRLVPAGRIPVLLAAALGGFSLSRFASANIAAVTAWATLYAMIGFAGGAIFPDATTALVVAVVAALLIGVLPRVLDRIRKLAPP